MTTTEIQEGAALQTAIMAQYRLLVQSVLEALKVCTAADVQDKPLSKKAQAVLARLKDLFRNGTYISIVFPGEPCKTAADAAEILKPIWAKLFFYPEISREQLPVYAESTALICDLLEYGWFE